MAAFASQLATAINYPPMDSAKVIPLTETLPQTPPAAMTGRCGTCRYYVGPSPNMIGPKGIIIVGACHLNPPSPVPMFVPSRIAGVAPTQGLAPGWPPVGPTDWCGQHSRSGAD